MKNTTVTATPMGWLVNYKTGETVGPATEIEIAASETAAMSDGGRGLFSVDGVTYFVEVR